MNPFKVLFIGLGGAGQRHLRILHDLLPEETEFSCYRRTGKTPFLRPDFTVDETKSVVDNFKLKIFENIGLAFANKPDLTIISTPTSCHYEPMMMALNVGSSIIVEKPWSADLTGFLEFRDGILKKNLRFLISFQRRYHPLIAKANHLIKYGKIGKPMFASFTVLSDVRSWHGYEDWRSLYAVRPELGGGVLLTEIHEVDLIYWFFGMPIAVSCSGGNRSAEKLDVEDTIQMILLYDTFSVQLTLCFMHKNKMRNFHVAGTDGDIYWNEENNELIFKSFSGYNEEFRDPSFLTESMFISQAKEFISNWTIKQTLESLNSASVTLAIVTAAKRSMKNGFIEYIDKAYLLE